MFRKLWSNKTTRLLCIISMGVFVALLTFTPYIYRYLTQGVVFSGSGDGYRQMMPFQMYLYEHFSQFKSAYDHSFGLGGDFVQDLSYYYSTSPFTYINFIFVWLSEVIFNSNPSQITFWASNQLIVAFIKGLATFVITFYYFKYLKFKSYSIFLAALLYGASTTVIYFNFTWSYYGDLLIFLPLSLLGIERFYKEKKFGLFIFAIALTLFSNFYFSYYEAIVILAYVIYRFIFPHPTDIVSRKQQLWMIPIAVILSTLIGIWGFYTGVSSFLNNDRVSNPHFSIEIFTDFARQKNFFSNGFYITVSMITIIALFSFKLYKHYYFRFFAIATWVMLIGSLTPYFDSMFNGFSTPERRWIYIFALTTSGLIALFIQHLSELNLKSYIVSCLPVFIIMGTMSFVVTDQKISWMSICLILILFIAVTLLKKDLLQQRWVIFTILCLFIVQQAFILSNNHFNNVKNYESTISAMHDAKYKSPALTKKINMINRQHNDDPLNRIDYMSQYGLNSPMLYHFNGTALYSSIFDGDILKYYDKTLQINMHTDKNSTYRLLSNRANLMALWNVQDRIRRPNDLNIPYGFKQESTVEHSKEESFLHSTNQVAYPSAHITDKVFDSKDLKSPLDREQAMLQGVVLNDSSVSSNQTFTANKNLLADATSTFSSAHRDKDNHLIVSKDNGGISYHLPKSITDKYEDMYVEMDVELLSPNKAHDVSVNEYSQQRNELSYKYRRFVTPVTMRVKANKDLNIQLSKGEYRFNIKGIYGEDYQTLRNATKSLNPVKVSQQRTGYTVTKHKEDEGYIVLPMAYRNGMKVFSGKQELPVKQGNGIMTVILTEKGQETITLKYTPPHTILLITLSLFGVISSIVFLWWLRNKSKNNIRGRKYH